VATAIKEGNTAELQAAFYDNSDALVDPDAVSLVIYDQDQEVLLTGITFDGTATGIQKRSTGNYYYEYTVPVGQNITKIFFEYTGTVDSKPSLNRKEVKVVWI